MKVLKWILIVLVILVAVPLIASFLVSGDYAVVRETTINKPKSEVFDYVKQLKNQNNYAVWNQRDPAIRQTYNGTDGTVGFVSAWESDSTNVGWGEQEIKKIDEGSRLETELRFKKPFEVTDNAYMTTEDAGNNTTKVSWGFSGKMPWPMNVLCLFMDMDKMIGPDLEQGLSNLKGQLENTPAQSPAPTPTDTTTTATPM